MDTALYNKYHRLVGLNGLNGYLFSHSSGD